MRTSQLLLAGVAAIAFAGSAQGQSASADVDSSSSVRNALAPARDTVISVPQTVTGATSGAVSAAQAAAAQVRADKAAAAATANAAGSAASSTAGSLSGISPGKVVQDTQGRAIGTVDSVRTATNTVLVKVGDQLVEVPASSLSANGDVVASAMTKSELQKAAKTGLTQ